MPGREMCIVRKQARNRLSLGAKWLCVALVLIIITWVASFATDFIATTRDGLNQFWLYSGRIDWNHRTSLRPQFFIETAPPQGLRFLGFAIERVQTYGGEYRRVSVPLWLLLLIASAVPIKELREIRLERIRGRRRAKGLCPQCGYDLRASGLQCPECGMVSDGEQN
jgi:hypothetical protein